MDEDFPVTIKLRTQCICGFVHNQQLSSNLMFIGPCIIVIVEE